MKTLFDIQNLLKRFGTFIYTGDRSADLDLMRGELQELYEGGLIQSDEYRQAILIIRREQSKYKNIH
ncbi:YqgQ family protein [Pseudalkalibacillus berkeleyi]|uniref:YqgQ family protein n=1 Tax=Pseudalkalibacillus berkeleyi TaxID=1069813 RepID=A0ABS9H247_9BACL|nr:YqgQ family protein [Pseudalkalibacillus berkeleyi]MCF6137902.1 YqgQ family protein [Pseudalkalibacillus berkeleyi]